VPRGGGAFADSGVNDGSRIQAGCRFDRYLLTHHVEDRLLSAKQMVRGGQLALACDDHESSRLKISALERPAFVPRTTGRRQEMTGTAGVSNRQVRNQIRPSPQVARSVPRTLSRWRHGFEPGWDYEQEPAGQRHSATAGGLVERRLKRRISRTRSCVANARSSRACGG
jgi:hypothetical protein